MPAKMSQLFQAKEPYSAGIYGDVALDGPEIGTLVVIVDRAKNLPNRRTMGKQDPYCACRLGKTAHKTNTDKRGGQVPRWDQELRFDVHDSADYYKLKVSVFNDDKKTELIGETWVSLAEVIIPGGGQSDVWHNLNCKGKYAGEVRLELTYYDTRPKPVELSADNVRATSRATSRAASRVDLDDAYNSSMSGRRGTPVKRRPLPSNPTSATGSPLDHGRPLPSSTGPRDYGTPPRQIQPHPRSTGNTPNSQRTRYNNNQPQELERRRPPPSEYNYPETPDDPFIQQTEHQQQQQYQQVQQQHLPLANQYSQHSHHEPVEASLHQNPPYPLEPYVAEQFLPELPPMRSARQPRSSRQSYSPSPHEHEIYSAHHPELQHTQSAPVIPPQYRDSEIIQTQPQLLHHSQSDNFVPHLQDVRHYSPGLPERIYDHQSNPPLQYQDGLRHQPQDYNYVNLPTQQRSVHAHADSHHDYAESHQMWALQPSGASAPEPPPPPPPTHRGSASSSAPMAIQPFPQHYESDYAPAPLNFGASRKNSQLQIYQDQQEYHQQSQYDDVSFTLGGRRYTDSASTSPHQEQINRPRALSGDSMQRLPSRDQSYSMSPGHGYGHGPIHDLPTEHHRQRRGSLLRYSDPPTPAAPSPQAVDSPRSIRESASLTYSQPNTPSLVVRYNQKQISPTKHITSQRPFPSESHQPQASYQTPPRQHPLAQENPAAASTYPPYGMSHSIASQSRPSSNSDLRQPRPAIRSSASSVTLRKSVSSRPSSASERRTSIPFGPDCFDQFNPSAGRSTSSLLNHPATSGPGTPMLDSSNHSSQRGSPYNNNPKSKIVDFHGNEIDPSDRLPETSWAPEPEPKGQLVEKPARERERLTGARRPGSSGSSGTKTSPGRMSIFGGITSASAAESSTTAGAIATTRNRLQKRGLGRPQSMLALSSASLQQPFRDIPNPPTNYNPSSEVGYGGNRGNFGWSHSGGGAQPPPIPAKVPISDGYGQGDFNSLSEAMRGIDIGSTPVSSRGRIGKGRLLGFR